MDDVARKETYHFGQTPMITARPPRIEDGKLVEVFPNILAVANILAIKWFRECRYRMPFCLLCRRACRWIMTHIIRGSASLHRQGLNISGRPSDDIEGTDRGVFATYG